MTEKKIKPELPGIQVPLANLQPSRECQETMDTRRYRAILASVKEIGVVEPLSVRPLRDAPGKYELLDGHQRFFALKELGCTVVCCTIASDKECV